MRQIIERAFGILTQRWGIFWRPLECAMDRWSLVIQAAAKLHNICIDANIEFQEGVYEDYAENDMPSSVFMNEFHPDHGLVHNFTTAHDSSIERIYITEQLAANGYTRPPHARCNSRAL
jgi:hypothetical protein